MKIMRDNLEIASQASPRREDLTKIKFARFNFNGVNTTLLDRKTKSLNNGAGGADKDAAPIQDDADMHTLIATGVLSGPETADDPSQAGGVASRSDGQEHGGVPLSPIVRSKVLCALCVLS